MKVSRFASKCLISGAFHAPTVLHLYFWPTQYQAPPMLARLAVAEDPQCLKRQR